MACACGGTLALIQAWSTEVLCKAVALEAEAEEGFVWAFPPGVLLLFPSVLTRHQVLFIQLFAPSEAAAACYYFYYHYLSFDEC